MLSEIEIFHKLKELFKLVVNKETDLELITMDSALSNDLGLNSVAVIYFVIMIEQTFDIVMDDIEFNDFKIIKNVVQYIQRKMK